MKRVRLWTTSLVLVLAAGAVRGAEAERPVKAGAGGRNHGAEVAFFEQHIRPLLAEHCYPCHSRQAKNPRGGLLLDSRQGWARGGDNGPAVVPGDPDKSLLIRAVRRQDDLKMPPKRILSANQVALLVRWVRMGAPDPRHGAAAAPT